MFQWGIRLLFVVVMSFVCKAQDQVISGVVVDVSSQKALEGVVVAVKGELRAIAITDVDGKYY